MQNTTTWVISTVDSNAGLGAAETFVKCSRYHSYQQQILAAGRDFPNSWRVTLCHVKAFD
jgi:hypothetical protein